MHTARDLGEVTTRYDAGWLVGDAYLETSGIPVRKLDGPLGLDGGKGCVDVHGNNVTAEQEAASHVLSVARVALDHLVRGLEARVSDLSNGKLFMVGLLATDHMCEGYQREVNTWVGHQVSLEVCQINVQSTVKTKRCSDGRDNLTDDKSGQVGVG